jgi:alkylation response protein AidB-like acyl-CoA dehydrogenase
MSANIPLCCFLLLLLQLALWPIIYLFRQDKMGYHGTPACEINFEDAVGYLVGKEHKGLASMFTFMNTARLGSAMMGVNAAEKSYQNALKYAKNRRAFRFPPIPPPHLY